MTTIILTIIGILLAAAAALMVIFYGGDAFNSGTVGAQANQLQNGGTNVISAAQMFKAEQAIAPASLADLTQTGANRPNGAYLDELPALATGQAATLETAGTPARQLYVVSGVSEAVCDRVNTNLRLAPAQLAVVNVATPATAAAAAALAVGADAPKMGCYGNTAAGNFFVARA